MDIAFYALVALAAAVLVLAMWSCAARGVNEWGPDLTPELLPYILQEQIRLQQKMEAEADDEEQLLEQRKSNHTKHKKKVRYAAPTAPSDSAGAPLLTNTQPIGRIAPKRPAPPPPPPPKPKKLSEPVFKNTVVRVLPADCIRYHQLRPTIHRFNTEEPV